MQSRSSVVGMSALYFVWFINRLLMSDVRMLVISVALLVLSWEYFFCSIRCWIIVCWLLRCSIHNYYR